MATRPKPRRKPRGRALHPSPRRIGVADTTFARVDLAAEVLDELARTGYPVVTERYTVPGMKDLAVACQILLRDRACDLALALGWVGAADIDETCAHEANLALQWAELSANKHILKVFVHERESPDPAELRRLAIARAREHALNGVWLLFEPERLTKMAGSGQRQGGADVGSI